MLNHMEHQERSTSEDLLKKRENGICGHLILHISTEFSVARVFDLQLFFMCYNLGFYQGVLPGGRGGAAGATGSGSGMGKRFRHASPP